MKARHPKTTKPKRRKQPTAARRRNSSAAGRQEQPDERTRELAEARKHLAEALEQQTATSEVLRIISIRPGELEPVFQAMLENATRICGAKFGILSSFKDGFFSRRHCVMRRPILPIFLDRQGSFAPCLAAFDALVRTEKAIHVVDLPTEPVKATSLRLGGARRNRGADAQGERVVGAIVIYRQEVRPFTDKQIELVETSPPRRSSPSRTRACSTSCARVRWSSRPQHREVLQVISRSPGELEPVFQAMLANAVRICGAKFGTL